MDYDSPVEVNVVVPADEDYPGFDELGLTDDAIRIVHDYVLANQNLRLTPDELAAAMLDVNGNESAESFDIATMVLDVWRQRNPDLEVAGEDVPREPMEGGDAEMMEAGEPLGQEFTFNVPREDEYDSFDDNGLTEDAISIVQNFVVENAHLQLTAEDLAAAMRDRDGNENPDVDIARMVLAVWKRRNPGLPAFEDGEEAGVMQYDEPAEYHYPNEEPATFGRSRSGSGGAGSDQARYVDEPATFGRKRSGSGSDRPRYAEEPAYGGDEAQTFTSEPRTYTSQPGTFTSEPRTYTSDRRVSDEPVRVHEQAHIVRDTSYQEPAVIVRDEPPRPVIKPPSLSAQRPGLFAKPLPASNFSSAGPARQEVIEVRSGPKPSELAITVPPEEDFRAYPQSSVLRDIQRLVRDYVVSNSSLGLSAEEIATKVGVRNDETVRMADVVLDAWRTRNPDIPLTSVVKYSYKNRVEDAPPKMRTVTTRIPTAVDLPGGRTLNIPAETDYPAFDHSGLTDDAIRIVRDFATNTGSLGITRELLAAEMVDFVGQKRPESVQIAGMVLDVWRRRNPGFPATAANVTYGGPVEEVIDGVATATVGIMAAGSPLRGGEEAVPVVIHSLPHSGLPRLVVPPPAAYTFDQLGLTDSAIRIVQEFAENTGSLGISRDLLAAEMVDNKGQKRAEALEVAARVLDVWRSANPAYPTTPAHATMQKLLGEEAAPLPPRTAAAVGTVAVYEAKKVEGQRVAALVPASSVAVQKAYGQHQEELKPGERLYTVEKDDFVFVEREDALRDLHADDLAYQLEPLGCGVQASVHPNAGPVVIFSHIMRSSVLHQAGVEPGDILASMDNQAITKPAQLYTLLSRHVPGSCFMWKLRRLGPEGTVREWSVVQNMPVRQVVARRPKFAGLPEARPYRSYSGLCPCDPGFEERYQAIPSRAGPAPRHMTKYWDTRVIDFTPAPLCITGCQETTIRPPSRTKYVEAAPNSCGSCLPNRVVYVEPTAQCYDDVATRMISKYQSACQRASRVAAPCAPVASRVARPCVAASRIVEPSYAVPVAPACSQPTRRPYCAYSI